MYSLYKLLIENNIYNKWEFLSRTAHDKVGCYDHDTDMKTSGIANDTKCLHRENKLYFR